MDGSISEDLRQVLISFLQFPEAERIAVAVAILVAAFVLRKIIARLALRVLRWLLSIFGRTLSDSVIQRLVPSVAMILLAGAALVAILVLAVSDATTDTLFKVTKTFMVLALYGAATSLLKPLEESEKTLKIGGIDEDMSWLAHLLKFLFAIVAVGIGSSIWGFDIGSLLTGAGVLGAAFALTLQEFVRDVVAGWTIRGSAQFRRGDWVELTSGSGTIEVMGTRTTGLRQFDQTLLIVPNQSLWSDPVVQWSHMRHQQILWTVGLPLETSGDQIGAICEQITAFIKQDDGFTVTDNYPAVVLVDGFGTSSINLVIEAYSITGNFRQMQKQKDLLARKILDVVEANGARLAVPVREIRDDPPGAERPGGSGGAPTPPAGT